MDKSLQQIILEELGKRTIEKTEVPDFIVQNLNPSLVVRPYQIEAFQYFLNFCDENWVGKPNEKQLLFHMATGSGKTLIMAGCILKLYDAGYRNFLFFVNSSNIIRKTKENFINPLSSKHLFNETITHKNKTVRIRVVDNFQAGNPDDINIHFTTIQGLHSDLRNPQENSVTFDDFIDKKIVMIADEAHHINVDTKAKVIRGAMDGEIAKIEGNLDASELEEVLSWEGTVKKIYESNVDNILLEFTATIDFSHPEIEHKYRKRLLYDYPLKQFRIDGYSKEVKVLQAHLPPFERALQAVILSQYRRKVFEEHGKAIKPVILFKSKTIRDSEAFFDDFKSGIGSLSSSQISSLRASTTDVTLQKAFSYFDSQKITLENLILELKEDFSEEKLISVNSKEQSEEKQLAVNTLEDNNNGYRVVFAVDKLNEGWDVLNLFDIVRLYDTRDAKSGKPGKGTISEAQLIGRGARYCPFQINPSDAKDQRKFDSDIQNPLRICEELYYHSAYNPKYIQELDVALKEIGIKAEASIERTIKLKDDFVDTSFYKTGLVFLNEQVPVDRSDVIGLPKSFISKVHSFSLFTGATQETTIFEDETMKSGMDTVKINYSLLDFGINVIRTGLQKNDIFSFSSLSHYFSQLNSVQEFIEAENYLGNIQVEVSGRSEQVKKLTQEEKLSVVLQFLTSLEQTIVSDKREFEGTKEFKPQLIRQVFQAEKTLNFAFDEGGDKEFGKSMISPSETSIYLDLRDKKWHTYDDCFGTSEEKYLVQYIDKLYEKLKKQYEEVYLMRNERFFKLYSFDDGKPLEPDFVLFLMKKGTSEKMYYQIFIEPKGGHLLQKDKWKEDFLKSIQASHTLEQLWEGKKYTIWGLPFYNRDLEAEFDRSFEETVLK